MDEKELKNISAYCVVPYSVMYDKDLSDAEVRLYIAISSLANQKGYCFASNNYLANSLGKSVGTIKRSMRHLEEKGFIRRNISKKDDNSSDRKIYISYDEIFEKPDENELPPVQKWTEGGSKMDRGGSKNEPTPQAKNGPHNNISINNINKIIKDNNSSKVEEEKYNYTLIAGKFIEEANKYELSTIIKLSDKRKAKLKARIDELGEDKILEAIDKIKESSFLRGENDRHWKIDFDWLIANDTNILKVLEDRYKDEEKPEEDDPWKKVGFRFWLI